MEGQTAYGIVAVAVLDVAADGMPEVLHVHADLVLATCVEFEFHKGMLGAYAECAEMGARKLAAVVGGRGIGEEGFVVLEPTLHCAFAFLHLARNEGEVAAVGHNLAPVVLENLLGLNRLGIDEQARRVAVEAVNDMGRDPLVGFPQVVVNDGLDGVGVVRRSHGENAHALFDDDDIGILIDEAHMLVLQRGPGFSLTDFDAVARVQGEVVLATVLAVDGHTAACQDSLGFVAADAVEGLHNKKKQLCRFLHLETGRVRLIRICHYIL